MTQVLAADDVSRALTRIAHEIIERHRGVSGLVLMGIQTRGVPLAARLAGVMADIEGVDVPHGALDIALYRDDYARTGPKPIGQTRFPTPIDGATVILIDDVLFTGRTIRSAMTAVTDHGRPDAIRLAVLIDRGHRELPIRADFVGKNLPTAREDDVSVRLAETDGGPDEVTLTRASETNAVGGTTRGHDERGTGR